MLLGPLVETGGTAKGSSCFQTVTIQRSRAFAVESHRAPWMSTANQFAEQVAAMLLEVRDFLSVKYARLETDENYAIVAGKNGRGKSQFVAAVVIEA
jgi:hypothetical protein